MSETLRLEKSIKATIIGQASLLIWALFACGAVALSALPG